MKIYTRTGDGGETSLFAGGRIEKSAARVHAYGTLDELNSVLGMVLTCDVPDALRPMLEERQNEIFEVGADLATPLSANNAKVTRLTADFTEKLEHEIDTMNAQLAPLKQFVLPGGSEAAATLHLARTVCRRAERWTVAIEDDINEHARIYINRLADWLFIAARYANHLADVSEIKWESSQSSDA